MRDAGEAPEAVPPLTATVSVEDLVDMGPIPHTSIYELWARATGIQLREVESGFRYTSTTCFETFPDPMPEQRERVGRPPAASSSFATPGSTRPASTRSPSSPLSAGRSNHRTPRSSNTCPA